MCFGLYGTPMKVHIAGPILALSLALSLILAACEPAGLRDGRDALDRGEFAVALSALQPLAEAGNAEASIILGFMHHDGMGLPRDIGRAASLWRGVADESDPATLTARGKELQTSAFESFFQGKGADVWRFRSALMWLRLAAEQGHAPAQSSLGDMYLNFDFAGITPDPVEGEKWLRRAAGQDDLNGLISLGDMYNDGLGVPKNYETAATWYRRAAELGDRTSQTIMARMYRDGRGLPKDLVQAHMWFEIAIASGEESVRPMLELAANKMTTLQIEEAQRLAEAWRAEHGKGN